MFFMSERSPITHEPKVPRKRLSRVPEAFRGKTTNDLLTAETSPLKGKVTPTEVFHADKNPRGQA
jgi:hypothetical protein